MKITMLRTVGTYVVDTTYDVDREHAIRWLELGFCKPEGAPDPARRPAVDAEDDVEVLNEKAKKAPKNRMARAPVKKGA